MPLTVASCKEIHSNSERKQNGVRPGAEVKGSVGVTNRHKVCALEDEVLLVGSQWHHRDVNIEPLRARCLKQVKILI